MFKILNLLKTTMRTPSLFGVFHLAFILLTLGAAAVVLLKTYNLKEKGFRTITAIAWLSLFLLELYKQIILTYNYNGGAPFWEYNWSQFPFQPYSIAIYVLPFAFFAKKQSLIRDAAVSYMAFFGLFSGLVMLLYPAKIFGQVAGVNIQAMLSFGIQVVVGVFYIVYMRRVFSLPFLVLGIVVFFIMLDIAMLLNIIVPRVTFEPINLFSISYDYMPQHPLILKLRGKLQWGVFVVVYFLIHTAAATAIFFASRIVTRRLEKINRKRKKQKSKS